MSDSDRPEITAFLELEHVIRTLGEELASFRRRALAAETQLRELTADQQSGEKANVDAEAVESENQLLRERLEQATDRTRQMLERVRFLRQQQARGEQG